MTAGMKEKVGHEGVTKDMCLYSRTPKSKPSSRAVNPSELQQDWSAGQNVKAKRGRKPKLMNSKERLHHKDGRSSEKQAVVEERSGSESSEHGEVFPVCNQHMMT